MKIVVTREKFDEIFSIDEWFNMNEISNRDLYDKMLHFCTDDQGQPMTAEQARAEFKKIPRKEWSETVQEFYRAVTDAFVNPTSGGN